MNCFSHNKRRPREINSTSRLYFLSLALLVLLVSACGSENTSLGPNQAMIVIEMPSMKSAARALDAKGSTIPAEITEILFEVADSAGIKIGKEQDFLKVKSVQFPLAAERDYTITGTARSGAITLFKGSETVAALKPGETRNVAVSLLAKIKFVLSVTSDLQNPQGSTPDATAPVQWILGQSKAIKVDVEGLDDDKTISWSVNDIPGGDANVGTVSPQGTYIPPATVPANPNIRIKAVPTAAPSFAKAVEVTLVPQPGSEELPISTIVPPAAPTNLSATAGDGQIDLAWTPVAGAAEYRVFRSTSAGVSTTDVAVGEVAEPPFVSLGLTNGSTYYFKVVATNLAGTGPDSAEISAKPLPPLPTAPTNLVATAGDTQTTLAWSVVAGASEYRIYRSTSTGVVATGTPLTVVTNAQYVDPALTNGTTYFYKVVAANLAGPGLASAEANAKPLPPILTSAPANFTATAGNTQIGLAWTAVTHATEYRIFRSTTAGVSATGNAIATVATSTFTDQGLTNGTVYYYKVVAANLAGSGPASLEANGKPLPALPAAPASVTATATDAKVALAWPPVNGATGYRIFRGTSTGTATSQPALADVVTAAYTDLAVANDTTYYYQVAATNLAGASPPSAEVFAKPLPPLPIAPINLVTSAGDGQITLSWAAVTGATKYRVFRSTSAGVSTADVAVDEVAAPPFVSLGLTNGSTYYFKVVATNLAGASPDSAEVFATPLPLLPTAPTSFSANATDAQVALSWNVVAGASSYRIFRSTSPGVATDSNATPIATANTNAHADANVVNGTTYYYKVVANNLAGDGPATGEISAKPLPPIPAPPASFVATAGDAQVNLAWGAVSGATEYRIFRSLSAGVSTSGTPFDTTTNAVYTDHGLTNGTAYFYRVVAANLAGPSGASAEVSAKPLPALPAVPANFSAIAGNAQVTLTWTIVPGATEYRVFRETISNVQPTGTPFATTLTASYTDLTVANGTTYYYRILASNLAGQGGASAEASAKPLPPLPGTPANVTALAGDGQITLNWLLTNGAIGYRIYGGTTQAGVLTSGTPIGEVNNPGFTSIALTNGATYFFRVVAFNLAGAGPDSAEVSAMPLPPLPAAPSNMVAAPSDSAIGLSWGAVAGASEYRIYRALSAGVSTVGPPLLSVVGTSYTDPGLTNGTTYFYAVVASNITGVGPSSAEVSAKPLPLLPSAPTFFTVTAGNGQASLSWIGVTDATEYRVYRGTFSGFSTAGLPNATVSNTSYVDFGLTNGTKYFYKVIAANVAGTGPASVELAATPLPPLPAAPSNLTATPGDAQVALNWSPVNGATEYRVYRSIAPGVSTSGAPLATVAGAAYTNIGLANGTTYYYRVLAANVAGASADSTEVSVKPLPPLPTAPTNVVASASDGKVALAWTAVAGATGYNIYSGTAAGVSTAATPVGSVTAPSFTSIGLSNGTTYYFRIVATNVAGASPDSAETSAKPLPPLPAAPANLTANAGDTQIALNWTSVAGASEYRVYRGIAPGVSIAGVPFITVNNITYTDSSVVNGTNYYYKVVAANLAGPSPSSAEITAKPLPPLPPAPTNFSANAGDRQVSLSWTAVNGASDYRVFRGTSAGTTINNGPVATVSTPFLTDQGLINGTTYYYVVVATNLAGPGPGSSEISAKPLPPVPGAPANLAATAGDTQVTLSWTPVAGATEYRVFRGISPAVSTAANPVATVGAASFLNTGLTNGTTYYFKVVAANLAGPGAASGEISAKPLPPIPGIPNNFTATAGDTQVSLSWAVVSGATEYRIYRGTATGVATAGAPFATVSAPNTVYADQTVTNGTTYFYKIVAANLAGPGSSSTEASAKPLPALPGTPINFTATPGDSQVALAWSAVTGASEYRIYRGTASGVATTGAPLATVTGLAFTNVGLVNGTTYYFKVVAANIAGVGPDSAQVNAKPLPPIPTAPTNLTAVAGDAQVALNWQAAANATEYRVYRSTTPGAIAGGVLIATIAGISYSNLGLTNGTTYYYGFG